MLIERLRRDMLRTAYPILKKVGKLHAPWTHKQIKHADVLDIMKDIQLGDIFLSYTYGEITNLLIPGHWKHVAMVVEGQQVIEAKDPKVVLSSFFDFMMTKDYCCLLRPYLSQTTRARAAKDAMNFLGKPYDYYFEMDHKTINDAFYCAEVPYWAYIKANPNWEFKLRNVFGVPTVKPDDYFLADRWFQLIWCNAELKYEEVTQ